MKDLSVHSILLMGLVLFGRIPPPVAAGTQLIPAGNGAATAGLSCFASWVVMRQGREQYQQACRMNRRTGYW
jgi:hypothetical protein